MFLQRGLELFVLVCGCLRVSDMTLPESGPRGASGFTQGILHYLGKAGATSRASEAVLLPSR